MTCNAAQRQQLLIYGWTRALDLQLLDAIREQGHHLVWQSARSKLTWAQLLAHAQLASAPQAAALFPTMKRALGDRQ